MTLVMQDAVRERIRAEVMDNRLIEQLRAIAPVKTGERLSRHTTFGIGGPADIFVTVRNADELARAVTAARASGSPFFILGAGSNILVGDDGIRGVVIDNQSKATRVEPLQIDPKARVKSPPAIGAPREGDAVVWAESGVAFASLAKQLARDGYSGIEWAAGIPGTMGGAVVYNAGAYEGCLGDVLLAVTILDGKNEQRQLPAAEMKLAYRSSAILRGECAGCVVLSVEIAVTKGVSGESLRRVAELDARRLSAQPRGRNSGSTFKNPPGDHAWRLIDAAGLRGRRIGGARISEKHPNFIENLGTARAADVAGLMREAQRRVKEQFGIDLENEVEMIGEGFA
jgi:UDP-N-acetylmuramate dehydrogenase